MLGVDLVNPDFRFSDQLFFDIRHHHVKDSDGDSAYSRVVVAQCFDIIQNFSSFCRTANIDTAFDNGADLSFANNKIALQNNLTFDIITTVDIAQILRYDAVKQEASEGRFNYPPIGLAISFNAASDTYFLLQYDLLIFVGHDSFIHVGKDSQRSIFCLIRILALHGQVVAAKNYILSRHCHWFAVLRLEEVIR